MRSALLVEDDFFDTMTVQKSFEKFSIPHKLYTAFNGLEALDLLLGRNGAEPISPLPEVILLDLNMPKMNGHEFLAEIRAHEALRDIPVFIITTSAMDVDRLSAQNLGVHGYILKPLDFETSTDMVDSISLLEQLLK
ncbi:CheY chemotaxis protein or a CheY-like REC (receiver) domain [Hymenobacter daecheongensis DSM 21074]|uniref:CheY chemotaxis protein or a CheY-like REC (Receiver) domain n=1 Tax=Hymenobacter daecheongensis DSM 21074 TaxID=1121955 RepID=A0A1M6GQE2_9BACT|nr:response regulator [Hymenobacter daecheongensis]SHJ12143.1 CheY chemotaxis protein or a CheY-like REC (receiver) domain [Hymenobacter daecheongensis DSM 21074]